MQSSLFGLLMTSDLSGFVANSNPKKQVRLNFCFGQPKFWRVVADSDAVQTHESDALFPCKTTFFSFGRRNNSAVLRLLQFSAVNAWAVTPIKGAHKNHSGRMTFNCQMRCSGTSTHWLIAALLMPRRTARCLMAPAFWMSCALVMP